MFRTKYVPSFLEEKEALNLYAYLRDNISWQDGIKSRNGFTRKAKILEVGDCERVDAVVFDAIENMLCGEYILLGMYLNYYENGNMYTPNHSHKGQHQIVISLGETRTLNIGKKSYPLHNGDLIMFGSSVHGVPKENTQEGRISIAIFLQPI